MRSLLWHRAAFSYAKRLGPQLCRDYGSSETYTAAQIAASVRRAGLPLARIALGYARYMSEPNFDRLVLEKHVPYAELRSTVQRRIHRQPTSAGSVPPTESASGLGGGDGGHSGGHGDSGGH